jgi:hypothetical protein
MQAREDLRLPFETRQLPSDSSNEAKMEQIAEKPSE